MNPEMTEILIGKHIDSEITPAEQRLLDIELKNNPEMRQMLSEMKKLHEQSQLAVNSKVVEKGKSAQAIFESAWQKHRLMRFKRTRLSQGRQLSTPNSVASAISSSTGTPRGLFW